MRTIQYGGAGGLLALLGACALIVGTARADVATERPGSILIFPKVVNANGRTTLIQIANTQSMPDEAHCFYVTQRETECAETDFYLFLTKYQPTSFDVSHGRSVMSGTGFSPGAVPPVPPDFIGALICVEVGPDGWPVIQNQLKGEATIVSATSLDQSKYNGITVRGITPPGKTDTLNLDGAVYNNCPATTVVDFQPAGATDPIIEALGNGGLCSDNGAPCNNSSQCAGTCDTGQSSFGNVLSLVPCNLDMENGIATRVTLQLVAWDEYEQHVSTSFSFSCVGNIDLGTIPQLLSSHFPGSPAQFVTVQLTPSVGGPVVGVLESTRGDTSGNTAGTAANLHIQGTGAAAKITVPSAL
jgi:hypothetical protein